MILVAGATGVLGSEIVRRLRQRGEPVRALVRETSDPEKVRSLEAAGAEIVRGDLRKPDSLRQACEGARAVISTVTSIATAREGDSFDATDGAGTRNLIDAARSCGVQQFVFVSLDTTKSFDAPLTAAKRAVEEHLRKSGLTYTILHPSLFMESWLGPMLFADPAAGTATVYGDGSDRIRYVAVADVAEVTVRSIDSPAARNAVIAFGGPEEISQRDAVKMFEEEFGKPFSVTEVPADALEAQWKGAQNPMEKTFAALMLGVARGFDSGVGPPPKELATRLTTPREFVRRAAQGEASA